MITVNKKTSTVENIINAYKIYLVLVRWKFMSKTPLKKVIKSKLKANKELTPQETLREQMKYDIVEELGLGDKVNALGWSSLTAEETGRIGGMMTKRKKGLKATENDSFF